MIVTNALCLNFITVMNFKSDELRVRRKAKRTKNVIHKINRNSYYLNHSKEIIPFRKQKHSTWGKILIRHFFETQTK